MAEISNIESIFAAIKGPSNSMFSAKKVRMVERFFVSKISPISSTCSKLAMTETGSSRVGKG